MDQGGPLEHKFVDSGEVQSKANQVVKAEAGRLIADEELEQSTIEVSRSSELERPEGGNGKQCRGR